MAFAERWASTFPPKGFIVNTIWEKLASVTVAVAALALAVVLMRREFFASRPSVRASGISKYEASWREIPAAGRVIGRTNAPVQLITFMDMECPFCSRFHATATQAITRYPNQVALVFIHSPIARHRFAIPAARAVECAATVGRFKEMTERIFAQQDSLGLKTWTSFALSAGVSDTNRFAACMKESQLPPAIERGVSMSERIGVSGTPTIILNGWRYGRPPSEAELGRAIEDLIAGRRPYPGMEVSGVAPNE